MSSIANETEEYDFLTSIFPRYRDWMYFESGKKIPTEDMIKNHGKWVIYGSKKHVEDFANTLRKEIGDVIDSIKYSLKPTRVTPNAPYRRHALIVYCHDYNREGVLSRLKDLGVRQAIWKYDRASLLEDLNDPSFCFALEGLNPGRLKYLSELAGIEIKPEITEHIQGMNKLVDDCLQKIKEFEEQLKS